MTTLNRYDGEVTVKDILILLRAMFYALVNPPCIDKTANQIRVQTTGTSTVSGSVTVSGSLTTVTGLTNIDSYQGKLLIVSNNSTAWAITVRPLIT